MSNCLICEQIQRVESKDSADVIAVISTGYILVREDRKGMSIMEFLSRKCVADIESLTPAGRTYFAFHELLVIEAAHKAFRPSRLIIEFPRFGKSHLYSRIIPVGEESASDVDDGWSIPPGVSEAPASARPLRNEATRQRLSEALRLVFAREKISVEFYV